MWQSVQNLYNIKFVGSILSIGSLDQKCAVLKVLFQYEQQKIIRMKALITNE